MKKPKSLLLSARAILIVSLMLSYLFPYCLSENYSYSYQLLDSPNGSKHYKLNLAVSQGLYDYYKEKSHNLNAINDFAKFVTPYALKPIADSLWQIYANDEDFVNGVLMMVHQITYEETFSAKYPVETIVENKGDCDLFSYVAASIIVAGGLDVVLLHYESETHMNIGVSLSHTPRDAREQAYCVTYSDIRYYVAECTIVGNWQSGWRVGECPYDLRNASVQIVTLENREQWAPGQISAGYENLEPSTISLNVSPEYLMQEGTATISGQLSPALQNENVTIYVKVNNTPWTVLGTAVTNSGGWFTYVWRTETAGICYIRASWSGSGIHAGADSLARTVTIVSLFFISLLAITVTLACVGVVLFFLSRHAQRETLEPQLPQPMEVPS